MLNRTSRPLKPPINTGRDMYLKYQEEIKAMFDFLPSPTSKFKAEGVKHTPNSSRFLHLKCDSYS